MESVWCLKCLLCLWMSSLNSNNNNPDDVIRLYLLLLGEYNFIMPYKLGACNLKVMGVRESSQPEKQPLASSLTLFMQAQ